MADVDAPQARPCATTVFTSYTFALSPFSRRTILYFLPHCARRLMLLPPTFSSAPNSPAHPARRYPAKKIAAECNNGTLDSVVSVCGTRSLARVGRLFACCIAPLIRERRCFQSETPLCLVGGVCLPFSWRYRLHYYAFLVITLYSFLLSISFVLTSLPLFLHCAPPSPLTSSRHRHMPRCLPTRGAVSSLAGCATPPARSHPPTACGRYPCRAENARAWG